MSEIDKVIPLSKVIELSDGTGVNKIYIEVIIQEDIPILCKNAKTKKERRMPFKVYMITITNFGSMAAAGIIILRTTVLKN